MPIDDQRIQRLRQIQQEADTLRRELEISPPNAVVFMATAKANVDELLVVEADGFGGATTSVVEGNFPLDYFTKAERAFATESEAVTAAEQIVTGRALAADVLTPRD